MSPSGFPRSGSRQAFALFVLATLALFSPLHAAPIEFTFTPPPAVATQNPFARELWAEVTTPHGRTLRLPAFFAGDNRFAVRARPEQSGVYRLGTITETTGGASVTLADAAATLRDIEYRGAPERPDVRIDPKNPRGFALATGAPFTPVGANLPWPINNRGMDYYREGIPAYGRVGLNWMRIWMSHWGGLNLDWRDRTGGPSPSPGTLDLAAAADWDELLALAEQNGLYLQVVLQHHGQYSTTVNPNWNENPWNAANPGGFLQTPSEFFTSARARELTKRKYRTIVARCAWSPAVMAWELFNEVHWVDALRNDKNVAAVARWHDEMADYIRQIDPYDHLVTTSTDDLGSPIYAKMDFYQPHLYPSNILAAIRTYDVPAEELHQRSASILPAMLTDRPIFYGEFGDDHQPLTDAEKKFHHAIVPPVWASLMGVGELPAQVWLGWSLLDAGRLAEHGAVAKFIAATKITERSGLVPFSAAVESKSHRVPLLVTPAKPWPRGPVAELPIPIDGRQPLEFADIPRRLGRVRANPEEHLPSQVTFRIDLPEPITATARFADAHDGSAAVRVLVDGTSAAEHTWPARSTVADQPKRPADLAFEVPAGSHTMTLEHVDGETIEFQHLDLGVPTAALAAIGKRNEDFIALWLWHRTEIFAINAPQPVTGTLLFENVPAGRWRITWWNTLTGQPARARTITHRGGLLKLPTPPVSRHSAVVLELQP